MSGEEGHGRPLGDREKAIKVSKVSKTEVPPNDQNVRVYLHGCT